MSGWAEIFAITSCQGKLCSVYKKLIPGPEQPSRDAGTGHHKPGHYKPGALQPETCRGMSMVPLTAC